MLSDLLLNNNVKRYLSSLFSLKLYSIAIDAVIFLDPKYVINNKYQMILI